MGKGLFIKKVISIQLSKNNALQGVVSNAWILPIIARKKINSSNNKKNLKETKTVKIEKPKFTMFHSTR